MRKSPENHRPTLRASDFCLLRCGPRRPLRYAPRPAGPCATETKIGSAQWWAWFSGLFSCGLRLLLLFAIFQVGFLRGSISQRLVCAPCVVAFKPFSQSLPQIA